MAKGLIPLFFISLSSALFLPMESHGAGRLADNVLEGALYGAGIGAVVGNVSAFPAEGEDYDAGRHLGGVAVGAAIGGVLGAAYGLVTGMTGGPGEPLVQPERAPLPMR